MVEDITRQGLHIGELHIDRGYINADLVVELLEREGPMFCRPWVPRNGQCFSKGNFCINVGERTITCSAGEVVPLEFGQVSRFSGEKCTVCPFRAKCMGGKKNRGRSVSIAENEMHQQSLREMAVSSAGRGRLRERIFRSSISGYTHASARVERRATSAHARTCHDFRLDIERQLPLQQQTGIRTPFHC